MGTPTELFYEIGAHAQIDPDVILGYRYPGDSQPMRIGDHAIIRSGTIIYANTTIGHRFQCGHQVLIRAEVTIGDRCVVHHKCTLEGRIRIGDGVKIMAHVYLPSTTEIGNMVFIGQVPLGPASKFAGRRTVRLTFFPLGPDKVRQFSEALNMDGTWSLNYDLIYTRRAPTR